MTIQIFAANESEGRMTVGRGAPAVRDGVDDVSGRDKLLEAAGDLFVEKGYRGTTFVHIAQRAGVSRGSIAWHFGSKEGLLSAVLDQQFALLNEGFDMWAATRGGDLSEFVTHFLRGRDSMRMSQLFVTLYVEALDPRGAAHEQFVGIHDTIRRKLQDWAVSAGFGPAVDGHDVSMLMFGTALGITMQWMLAPDRVDPDQLSATLAGVLRSLAR